MHFRYFLLILTLVSVDANADSSTLDAAIGGAIGGAGGAAIGNELGGRDGAIIGGALGAALGTAVNTNQRPDKMAPHRNIHQEYVYPYTGNPGYHCPPGQAKKGRC